MHYWPSTVVTGFAKRGLPHTSNSMNFEDCNLGFKAHTNLKFSTFVNLQYVGSHCYPNFTGMAVFNLKLLTVKVGKLDECGRPLFTNPVTYDQFFFQNILKIFQIFHLFTSF